MKVFEFSLRKLLEVKEALEKAAELRLADHLRRLESARRLLKELSGQCQRAVAEIEALDGMKAHRHKFTVHLRYLERLQAQASAQVQVVLEQEMAAEQARQELCEYVRERKSLEKLQDQERKRWLVEQRRKEQKETDEYAAHGFIRQHGLEMIAEGG